MISQAVRIHEITVTRHLNGYLQSEKLTPENGGSQSKLNAVKRLHSLNTPIFILTKLLNMFNIELHYLPPYSPSPNLNPIGRLWKVMHEIMCISPQKHPLRMPLIHFLM